MITTLFVLGGPRRHDLVRHPLGRLRKRRRAHNLVELCVEPGNRIGEVRQRLITVLVDEPS